MSWDVILTRVSPDNATVDEIEKRAAFLIELGPKAEVLSALGAAFPEIDLADPAWGILQGEGFSIEFNLREDDPVKQIMLHVRGSDLALGAIRRLCESTGWRALNMSTGDFMDFTDAGPQQWHRYRDQVIAYLESEVVDPRQGAGKQSESQ
jgi:hypothetical protein